MPIAPYLNLGSYSVFEIVNIALSVYAFLIIAITCLVVTSQAHSERLQARLFYLGATFILNLFVETFLDVWELYWSRLVQNSNW
jgi:hypothetical protein